MPRPRPGALTVVAVLGIVYGCLATTCNLCGVFGLAMQGTMSQGFPGGDEKQAKLQKDLEAAIERDVPAYRAIQIALPVVSLLLGIAMLAAGIGLLRSQAWARLLAMLTALVAILVKVFEIAYQLIFVIPASNKALNDVLPGAMPQGQPGGQELVKFMQVFVPAMAFVVVGILVLVIVYLLIIVMLLLRRDVRAAVSGADAAAAAASGDSLEEGWGASAPPAKPEDEWGIQREK